MKKYIIWIDSLITTFSIVESGKDISYNYQDKDNANLFDNINQGDVILGYYAEPIEKVNIMFLVKDKMSGNTLVLSKVFETAEGTIIEDKGFVSNLEEKGIIEISDSQYAEFVAGIKNFCMGLNDVQVEEENIHERSIDKFDYSSTKGAAINKIFFGTPGCGKSYHIEHDILGKDNDTKEYIGAYSKERIIRTTFYQDYSNTDFVGQILPKVVKGMNGEKDTVEYIFNPGPFTLALIQAISNPTKKVALVIEEINRGNAPAIFGDIFQLLDRDENGISEYGIVNVSMMDYLNAYEFTVDGEKKRYTFSEIKIPGNMDIFATMNTSDQNVYTLDTAFVRRWDKEKIRNSFTNCTFNAMPIPGMPQYTWEEFVTSINKCIAGHLEDLQVNEDKQIGAFFVKESLLASKDAEKFAYKVFDYLWSDVAKLDHGIFFNHFDTLESLIDAYKTSGVGVFKTGVFEAKATVSAEEEENNE